MEKRTRREHFLAAASSAPESEASVFIHASMPAAIANVVANQVRS
jgi:hypothetical protein